MRVPTPALEVRLVRTFGEHQRHRRLDANEGRGGHRTECPLIVHASEEPVSITVRIVRVEPMPVSLPGGMSQLQQYLVRVMFTELSAKAKRTIAAFCGPAFTEKEYAAPPLARPSTFSAVAQPRRPARSRARCRWWAAGAIDLEGKRPAVSSALCERGCLRLS